MSQVYCGGLEDIVVITEAAGGRLAAILHFLAEEWLRRVSSKQTLQGVFLPGRARYEWSER